MKIIFKSTFVERLEKQLDYISINNPENARSFKNDLIEKIKAIPNHPYAYRKSIYFNSSRIRDFIFKGYTVVFRINKTTIEVFGLLKYQDSIHD